MISGCVRFIDLTSIGFRPLFSIRQPDIKGPLSPDPYHAVGRMEAKAMFRCLTQSSTKDQENL